MNMFYVSDLKTKTDSDLQAYREKKREINLNKIKMQYNNVWFSNIKLLLLLTGY